MSIIAEPTVKERKSTPLAVLEAVLVGIVATYGSILVSQIFNWLTWGDLKFLEVASVFFSYACTWLCVKQYRANYYFGVVATSLLVILFAQQHLLGSMWQNIYLVPTLIYGWFIWGNDKKTKPVEHVKLKYGLICLALTGILYAATVITLSQFNASLLFWDAVILAGSILAQWLLDRKILENWIVWGIVDVIAIVVYWHAGLFLVAIQFFLFLINAVYGWFQWYGTMKKGWKAPKGKLIFAKHDDGFESAVGCLNEVWWYDAEIPPADHKCYVQTKSIIEPVIVRCACGSIREGDGEILYKNTRAAGVNIAVL